MKENILGPRQWAFVVITGGAACALPFLQTDNPPTATDTASTSFPHEPALDPRYTLGRPIVPGGPLVAPSAVSDIVPALPTPRVPEWANADRSPFDDLVGATAAKPEAVPPHEQPPMQPLRPWIAGPNDPAALVAAPSRGRPGTAASAAPSAAEGAIARLGPSAAEASPWSAEPVGFTPIDQLASGPSLPALSAGANGGDGGDQWPDQAVSAEEIAQLTRARERELAAASVRSPGTSGSPSSSLLAAPTIPVAASSPTVSTLPVAAQRSGPAFMPSQPASSDTLASGDTRDEAPRKDLNLPSLPPARKSHIIFQPGNWQ